MFSLDISFLNDPGRQDYTGASKGGKTPRPGGGGRPNYIPAILGALVGIALPAALAGYWYYLSNIETPKLQARSAELDGQIAELQKKLQEAEAFNQQAAAIEADVAALSGVFDKVRPWSAILLDIAQRTPPDVEIKTIAESGGALTISGVAVSQTAPPYDKVNDFFLLLQRSPFLLRQETRLGSTALQETKPAYPPASERFKITQLEVTFSITSKLDSKPNSTLLAELTRLQSRGLVGKLRTIQTQQGQAQPTPPQPASPAAQPQPGGTP